MKESHPSSQSKLTLISTLTCFYWWWNFLNNRKEKVGNSQDLHGAFLLCNTTVPPCDPRNRALLPRPMVHTEASGGHAPNWSLFPLYAQNVTLNKNICGNWNFCPAYLPFGITRDIKLESTLLNKGSRRIMVLWKGWGTSPWSGFPHCTT